MSIAERACDTIPEVFCWTKMGSEGGQSLEEIIRRKEMERLAGNGTFCWGIGNALGDSPALARQAVNPDHIEVLFTPLKGPPKHIDVVPRNIVIWLTYVGADGRLEKLSDHMLVTSRGINPSGQSKRRHYALMCTSDRPIGINGSEIIDATRARNFGSATRIGSSQVTAVVSYDRRPEPFPRSPYRVAFRASLIDDGFVRLATAVELRGNLLKQFQTLCKARTFVHWHDAVLELKSLAWKAASRQLDESDLLGAELGLSQFKPFERASK